MVNVYIYSYKVSITNNQVTLNYITELLIQLKRKIFKTTDA